MSNIIDFDSLRNQMGSASGPLFEQAAEYAADRIFRSALLLQISAEADAKIKEIGLDPANFEIDEESLDRFYETETLMDDDAMWNGPWFDWEDDEFLYRVASKPVLDKEGVCPSIIDVLRIEEDADEWQIWDDGKWVDDGPPEDFFELSADEMMMLREEEEQLELSDLPLISGTHMILTNAGIDSIAALQEKTDQELLGIRGIGKARLADIREQLQPENLERHLHMKKARGMLFDALFGGDDDYLSDDDWDEDDDWDDDVDNLDISNDTFDILTINGVDTISQLRDMSEMELMKLPGMAKWMLDEIKEALEE